jgi:hypothetical protein
MIKEIRKDTMPIARFYAMPMLMQTQSRYACVLLFQIPTCDAVSMPNTIQMLMLMPMLKKRKKERTP